MDDKAENSCFSGLIRDVIVVASSSRGGSSVFAEVLRRCDSFIHFRAEINPFLHDSGLTYPKSRTGSDVLEASALSPNIKLALDRVLSQECGNPRFGSLSSDEMELYVLAVLQRLSHQWPQYDFTHALVKEWLLSGFDIARKLYDWQRWEVRDSQLFWCIFLKQVHTQFPKINPYYYDLSSQLVQSHFPETPVPEGPPSSHFIEEPPFVIPVPFRHPTKSELAQKPLIIKTPSNVYRFGFLQALFPNATFWILHLTRNAPHSINGLMDGWCHRGFFSHWMPGKLNISGYSNRFPRWGSDWWNFDLPPGWQDYTSRPLVEVCAYQWYSAHQAISEFRNANPNMNYLRVQSEDVLSESEAVRRVTSEKIASWLGGRSADKLIRAMTAPVEPVMATQPPKKNRWLEKADSIIPVLRQGKIKEMVEELGYLPVES